MQIERTARGRPRARPKDHGEALKPLNAMLAYVTATLLAVLLASRPDAESRLLTDAADALGELSRIAEVWDPALWRDSGMVCIASSDGRGLCNARSLGELMATDFARAAYKGEMVFSRPGLGEWIVPVSFPVYTKRPRDWVLEEWQDLAEGRIAIEIYQLDEATVVRILREAEVLRKRHNLKAAPTLERVALVPRRSSWSVSSELQGLTIHATWGVARGTGDPEHALRVRPLVAAAERVRREVDVTHLPLPAVFDRTSVARVLAGAGVLHLWPAIRGLTPDEAAATARSRLEYKRAARIVRIVGYEVPADLVPYGVFVVMGLVLATLWSIQTGVLAASQGASSEHGPLTWKGFLGKMARWYAVISTSLGLAVAALYGPGAPDSVVMRLAIPVAGALVLLSWLRVFRLRKTTPAAVKSVCADMVSVGGRLPTQRRRGRRIVGARRPGA